MPKRNIMTYIFLGTQKDLFAIQKTILRLFGFSIDDEEYGILYNIYSILALAFSVSFPTTLYIFSVFNNSDTASRIESIAYATACTSSLVLSINLSQIKLTFAFQTLLKYSLFWGSVKNLLTPWDYYTVLSFVQIKTEVARRKKICSKNVNFLYQFRYFEALQKPAPLIGFLVLFDVALVL